MIVKVTPQRKEPEITAQPWVIEHTVELPPGEFRYFKPANKKSSPKAKKMKESG